MVLKTQKQVAEKDTVIDQGRVFNRRVADFMPRWAWAICGILLALSFSVRQMDIDINVPLSRIFTAYATLIEKEAMQIDTTELKDKITAMEQRIMVIENSHRKKSKH